MPFIKIAPNVPTNNEKPIFLFPGVLGNVEELTHLWKKIDDVNDSSRPIYVLYQDDSPYTSLEEEAQSIGEEMWTICKHQNPCDMVGFSMGCIKAAFAARYLQKKHSTLASLFLIDGPTPEVIQAYFSHQPSSAIKDMLEIVNYAAKLSHLQKIALTEKEIKDLVDASVNDRFKLMEDKIKKNNPDIQLINFNYFKSCIDNANRNLQNIMTYTAPLYNKTSEMISSIKILVTQATGNKYNDQFLGWQTYTKRLLKFGEKNANETSENIDNLNLIYQQHTNLLTSENTTQLIPSINHFFSTEAALYYAKKTADAVSKLYSEQPSHCYLQLMKKFEEAVTELSKNISPSSSPTKTSTLSSKLRNQESKIVICKVPASSTLNNKSSMFSPVLKHDNPTNGVSKNRSSSFSDVGTRKIKVGGFI